MTLDDLLKLAKRPRRIVPVPVGSQTVHVRGLSAAEVEEAARLSQKDDGESVRSYLLAMALCDEHGEPLCGDPKEHAPRLSELPASVVRRIDRAIDEASDVPAGGTEGMAKNSPTEGFGTAAA